MGKKNVRQPLQLATTIVKGHRAALHTKVCTFAVQRVTFICQRFAMTEHRDLTFSCVGPGRPFGSRVDGARRLSWSSSSLDPKSSSLKLFVEAVELARAKVSVVFVSTTLPKSPQRNPQFADSPSLRNQVFLKKETIIVFITHH